MEIKNLTDKKILILGLGREGTSTLRYLRKKFPKKLIGLADQKTLRKLDKEIRDIIKKDKNLKLYLDINYPRNLNDFDVILKSPGLRLEKPTIAEVTSQTKIFLKQFRDKIIGITGTKGKSTTSSLIYKILRDAKLNAHLLGNIGNPPFDVVDKISKTDYIVYEFSSYQLQDLKVSPHIAVFLNLYKEHLDYHGGFEKYKKAKLNILKWQNKKDIAVYNADADILAKIANKCKAHKISFSLKNKLKSNTFVEDEWLLFNREKVLKISETRLLGRFSLNNILAAVAVAKILKIPNRSIAHSVKTFEPLKHRLQHIGNFRGIDFYNDSIATIPEATIAALETLSPSVATLIVGGYDRGVDYSKLSKKIVDEKIQNVILFPQTGKIILEGIKIQKRNPPKHFFVKNMKEAVKTAVEITQKGKICLLSPASPSFNLFKNYQDRGDQFRKEVTKFTR